MGMMVTQSLLVNSVANREAITTFGTAASQHLATILRFHASTETMLVSLLEVRGLECTFHLCSIYFLKFIFLASEKSGAKLQHFFKTHKPDKKIKVFFLISD